MKKLTEVEFTNRMHLIARATRIFVGSGLTNNVSVAFKIYQEVLADEEEKLALMISQKELPSPVRGVKCPECGSYMRFRMLPLNSEYKLAVECMAAACDVVFYTNKSPSEIISEAEKDGII